MIRVLLADDDADILALWQRALTAADGFELVGSHAGCDGLSETIRSATPNIVISDLGMHGPDPAAAIRELAAAHGDVRFVVYSGRGDAEMVAAAFDAGIWGYVDKMCKPEELFDALRRVAGGEVVFPPNFAIDQDA